MSTIGKSNTNVNIEQTVEKWINDKFDGEQAKDSGELQEVLSVLLMNGRISELGRSFLLFLVKSHHNQFVLGAIEDSFVLLRYLQNLWEISTTSTDPQEKLKLRKAFAQGVNWMVYSNNDAVGNGWETVPLAIIYWGLNTSLKFDGLNITVTGAISDWKTEVDEGKSRRQIWEWFHDDFVAWFIAHELQSTQQSTMSLGMLKKNLGYDPNEVPKGEQAPVIAKGYITFTLTTS